MTYLAYRSNFLSSKTWRRHMINLCAAAATMAVGTCFALQLPFEGTFQIKTQELKVNGEVLVKNAIPTKTSVEVPRSEIVCIKLPSDWEKTRIWTGSYRTNCFNGSFVEAVSSKLPLKQFVR